jgi:transcriptional regulator with XRE-family HTH domain
MTSRARARPRSGRATGKRDQRHPQAVDLEVARRFRRRRLELGLTLQRMAELVGVTTQQAQKYEAGLNRLSVGRLHRIGEVLGVEVEHFFANVDPEPPDWAGVNKGRRRMLLDLLRHVAAIRDPGHREAICALAREMAALGTGAPAEPSVEQGQPPPEPQSGPIR